MAFVKMYDGYVLLDDNGEVEVVETKEEATNFVTTDDAARIVQLLQEGETTID